MFRFTFTHPLALAVAAPGSGDAAGFLRVAPGRVRPTSRAAEHDGAGTKAVVYRQLFDQYWPRIHRHLECFIDDAEEVEELTAEVFLIAWRKLDPASPMGLRWFLRTADNKLRDRSRRARSRDSAIDALTRGLSNPAEPLDPMEALALRRALRSLSARERQVVVLTYWDELSAGEVAEALHTSPGAVWTTLTRARTKLRVQLETGRAR